MKRIAISQRVIEAQIGARRDALEQDYVQYYSSFGICLLPVPNVLLAVGALLTELRIDGIILSGGNDVHPKLYGGQALVESTASPERDKTENELLGYARENNLPVLCECRGCQFLNVYFGGRLREVRNHVATPHEVQVLSEQGLYAQTMTVNSYHRFAIAETDLSDSLRPFAYAFDSTIEGVFHKDLPFVGVMWHPERELPDNAFNKMLVNAFIARELFWKGP